MPEIIKRTDKEVLQDQEIEWCKRRVSITGVYSNCEMQVEALAYLCMHNNIGTGGGSHSITHIPSGKRLVSLHILQEARSICEYLIARFIYAFSLRSESEIQAALPSNVTLHKNALIPAKSSNPQRKKERQTPMNKDQSRAHLVPQDSGEFKILSMVRIAPHTYRVTTESKRYGLVTQDVVCFPESFFALERQYRKKEEEPITGYRTEERN